MARILLKPTLAALLLSSIYAADFPADPTGWPAVTATQKPWTRWWWLGSAVDKPNLTSELEDFAKAGIGGVEICPIYGAVGAEDRFIDFLNPKWIEMLGHTTTEAKRLGLGVDMTTGTGWPFGGPQVTPEIASAGLNVVFKEVAGGEALTFPLPKGALQCLRAYPASGAPIDLTDKVSEGKLVWQVPVGKWKIVGLTSPQAIQKVKRAAPGGSGNVLDPFSPAAMTGYTQKFDEALQGFTAPIPRAQFHDSFEYYGAAWTTEFFEKFSAARGYDLRDQLLAFAGDGDAGTVDRVRSDYRETLSELHLAYLQRWHDWAKSHGEITRNQAHGSPGNLLDHYAVSEIPETEIFKKPDETLIPMIRLAASAAQANGTNLVSSETFTWLDEHFQVTPEELKSAADFVFLGGVNHVFFHGIPYSPKEAQWPGWLFYASTHLGENGGLWRDLPAFNAYLQRCQSILQSGQSSQDLLIYFPIHDIWNLKSKAALPLLGMHSQEEWLFPTTFYQTSMQLWNSGITYNYASDAMLDRVTVRDGKVELGGHSYQAFVLPGVKSLSPASLKKISGLVKQGATLVVQGGWPETVPGFDKVAERRSELLGLQKQLSADKNVVLAKSDILPALAELKIRREKMADSGLRFARRSFEDGFHYFIVNRSEKAFDGFLPLAVSFQSAVVLNPWQPADSFVAQPETAGDDRGISIRLAPGESTLIRTYTDRKVEGKPWVSRPVATREIPVAGPWELQFIEGGPSLPAAAKLEALGSWTGLPDTGNFSGTARYTTSFDLAEIPADAKIDLGRVANTARVTLNGQPLGISWSAPHVLPTSGFLKPGKNELAIEVTNLAANRIADLDRRKVEWKKFHEINFVGIDYKPLDASNWPAMESGLIGPVKVVGGK